MRLFYLHQEPLNAPFLKKGLFARGSSRGKTVPWVDSACADCAGFLVLSAASAPASTFVSEPQIVVLG